MKTQTYKGEWKANENKVMIPVTREASNIIEIKYGSESVSQEDIAKLIASAPEMLGALMKIKKCLEGDISQQVIDDCIVRAEQVIRKTTL